jgi:uroporphyrin-III C-methyltransferase
MSLLMFQSDQSPRGFVTFVGAGPGAADLITVRGLRALQLAEVVLFDELPGRELLAYCHPDAVLVSVGKRATSHSASQAEINALLLEHAGAGKQVVRLKGGDPTVFGRLGEELAALREAGIGYEIVPGVTAACAAAAAAGISLTQRGIASATVFATGHECAGKPEPAVDWTALARPGATLCVYMGKRALGSIAMRLTAEGLPAETPLLIVSHASQPTQRILAGTLADAAALAATTDQTPALVLIGEAVAQNRALFAESVAPLAHAAP